MGAACANPRPTDFDVACAFLDAEDVEVNVHEADSNTEFLEGNLEVALDSGAGDHVTAETEAPAYTVEESPGRAAFPGRRRTQNAQQGPDEVGPQS